MHTFITVSPDCLSDDIIAQLTWERTYVLIIDSRLPLPTQLRGLYSIRLYALFQNLRFQIRDAAATLCARYLLTFTRVTNYAFDQKQTQTATMRMARDNIKHTPAPLSEVSIAHFCAARYHLVASIPWYLVGQSGSRSAPYGISLQPPFI